MERYTGQLKNAKFTTTYGVYNKERCKKCLDIFSFDIEVTSAWKDPKRGLITYEPGHPAEYWNDLDKYALPYVWQFGFNDKVYYGRDLKEFKDLLSDLPKNMALICFIHNLSYEQQFLINILHITDIFARAPHKPMKFNCEEFPLIEFRCSYFLTNLSLAKWGDQLGIPKLVGELEYNYMRTPLTPLFDYELDYAERDCEVVFRGIRDLLKSYKNVWDIPLTSTGKVRRRFKALVVNDKEYMKDVKRTIPKDANEYKRLQQIFSGGYTHCNRKYLNKIVENVHHVDISSSYPFCLCAFRYPYNKWCYIGTQFPDPNTYDQRAYIIHLHFTKIVCVSWNTYIQGSKCRGSGFLYDNGRILSAEELFITCTCEDWQTIQHNYIWESVECLGTYCNQKRYLPKPFIEFVLDLYHDKTAYKGFAGVDEVKDTIYKAQKAAINSLFGMCVTSLFQSNVMFEQDADYQWNVEPISADIVNEGLDKLRLWYNKKYFLSYSVGCYCTAYARNSRLWRLIESCDDDLIYTDTDSLFYINEHDWQWFNDQSDKMLMEMCDFYDIDFERTRPKDKKGVPHPLGHLDFEPDAERFKSLGSKKYCEERDNKLYLTVAGVNKGAVECLNNDINNFCDGFVFDKDHPSMHKLEHTYLSDMKPIMWPDGYKSDFKYGINMRPTGYQLSLPNIYEDIETLMSSGIINFSEYFIAKRRGYFNV